jgi:hypothetical protein
MPGGWTGQSARRPRGFSSKCGSIERLSTTGSPWESSAKVTREVQPWWGFLERRVTKERPELIGKVSEHQGQGAQLRLRAGSGHALETLVERLPDH